MQLSATSAGGQSADAQRRIEELTQKLAGQSAQLTALQSEKQLLE